MSVYWRCLVFLLLLASLHKDTNAQKNTKILSLPGKNTAEAYIDYSSSPWTDNLPYTFCMWMKVDNNITFFDYAVTYGQPNREWVTVSVIWYPKDNRIAFGSAIFFDYFSYCPPRSWVHLCEVFLPNDPDRMYVNGKQVDIQDSTYNGIISDPFLNKIFKLPIAEKGSFTGMLYNLNVWNSLLTDQQITDLANCKSKAEGDQLSWTNITQNLQLKEAEFITGTGPCTTPITRQNVKLLNVDDDGNVEPVNCTASSSSLPEPSSAPMTEDSSQPSSGSSSLSNQPDGSSQPSSGSSSS